MASMAKALVTEVISAQFKQSFNFQNAISQQSHGGRKELEGEGTGRESIRTQWGLVFSPTDQPRAESHMD